MKKIIYFLLIGTLACKNFSKKELIQVFEDNSYQFTGVAVDQTGRVFVNYPRWDSTHLYSLVEIIDGKAVPYPNLSMNSWHFGQETSGKWICIQAVFVDEKNILWVVDPASPFLAGIIDSSASLTAIDLATNQIIHQYVLKTLPKEAYINDVRIDYQNQLAYLSNSNTGSLIVVNLKDTLIDNTPIQAGEFRNWFSENKAFLADNYVFKPGKGKIWSNDGVNPIRVNSDGIALTPDNQLLYFKSLTDDQLYSIPTSALTIDHFLNDEPNAALIENHGNISTSDGMIFDKQGKIYLGDLENNQIIEYNPSTKTKNVLIQSDDLLWPDSFAIFDDYLYVACSQIHLQAQFNQGVNQRTSPYKIFKIKIN